MLTQVASRSASGAVSVVAVNVVPGCGPQVSRTSAGLAVRAKWRAREGARQYAVRQESRTGEAGAVTAVIGRIDDKP